MLTLSKTEFHTKLLDSLKRLGENTNKSIVLIDAKDATHPIVFCNEPYCNLTGFSLAELVGQPYDKLFSFQNTIEIKDTLKKGEIASLKILHTKKDHHFFQAQIECFPLQNDDLQTEIILIMVTDITHKVLLKSSNELERKMFRAIESENTLFEKITLACEYMDKTCGPEIFSTIAIKFEDELYITSAVPFEDSYTHLIPKGMAYNYYSNLMKLDDSKVFTRHKGYALSKVHQQYALENEQYSCWQIPIPNHSKEVIGVITIFFRVQRRPREFYNRFIIKVINLIGLAYNYEMKQQEIFRHAYTDMSTGLPNRHALFSKQCEIEDGSVLVVQPSDFSKFVEMYGRKFGDELLSQLAYKLNKISAVQFIAQFTSSSLALVIDVNHSSYAGLNVLFERITREVFHVMGNNIYITLKVGVVLLKDEDTFEQAIRNAENALSVAKNNSGTQIIFYDDEMQEKLKKELIILNELVEAIKNKEFQAYVQPKIEIYRGRISSLEALARWISPKLGFVSPGDFIPIAERAGLIREIDLQIFEQILIWMQKRQYEGKIIVPVSVNISPEHFYHRKFILGLLRLMRKYYADPKYIIIEVTESISLVDIKRAQEILVRLRVLGFQTSVDDFGVGYSSLTYLQKLAFTELKLDQSFVRKINEAGTFAIVKSIQQIGYHLQMNTVAEGVETKEQLQLIKNIGCDVVQGYYFYKPMSIEEIEKNNILK